jgi:hypothetical protein
MEDPTKESVSGDILKAENNFNINAIPAHPIIYLGPHPDNNYFLGAMLTHSPRYSNVALQKNHLKLNDDNNNPFEITYDGSFISSDLYQKKMNWAPFTKVGELTLEGLDFVLAHVGDKIPKLSPLNRE